VIDTRVSGIHEKRPQANGPPCKPSTIVQPHLSTHTILLAKRLLTERTIRRVGGAPSNHSWTRPYGYVNPPSRVKPFAWVHGACSKLDSRFWRGPIGARCLEVAVTFSNTALFSRCLHRWQCFRRSSDLLGIAPTKRCRTRINALSVGRSVERIMSSRRPEFQGDRSVRQAATIFRYQNRGAICGPLRRLRSPS
jgi:hypothetical protein